jgi:hypothetical protein
MTDKVRTRPPDERQARTLALSVTSSLSAGVPEPCNWASCCSRAMQSVAPLEAAAPD